MVIEAGGNQMRESRCQKEEKRRCREAIFWLGVAVCGGREEGGRRVSSVDCRHLWRWRGGCRQKVITLIKLAHTNNVVTMSVEGHASTVSLTLNLNSFTLTLPLISYSYAYAVVSKSEVCSCWHFTCESCIEECTAWIWILPWGKVWRWSWENSFYLWIEHCWQDPIWFWFQTGLKVKVEASRA